MNCKPLSAICAVTALALGTASALADAPAPAAAAAKDGAAALGRLDALLTVCAKGDVKHRAIYQKYRNELVVFAEGTPQEMRAPGSDTPEYKNAYAEVVAAAAKARAEEIERECGRIFAADTVPQT